MDKNKPVDELTLDELINELNNLAYKHGISRTGQLVELAAKKLDKYYIMDKIKEQV